MDDVIIMDSQPASGTELTRSEMLDNAADIVKDLTDANFDEAGDEDDGSGSFRGGRGRGNFRARGRGMAPPGWMNGPPPMRFRGRGYGPAGPPMRGRGFFRGRGGGPRFGPNGNYDASWGPMGPPPPGMMGGPPPFGPPPGMMAPGGPMGPPPNMMGQPPPYGPPGMPPNMSATDIWVETKADDGKSYYYHSRTRETTWTRPQESPTCTIISQAEMEAMPTDQMGQPMVMPMGGPPMGMMANGMTMSAMMPPGVGPQGTAPAAVTVPSFMTQPPPWMKDGGPPPMMATMKSDKSKQITSPNADVPPGETVPMTPIIIASNPPRPASVVLPLVTKPRPNTSRPWGWGWQQSAAQSQTQTQGQAQTTQPKVQPARAAALPDAGAATQTTPATKTPMRKANDKPVSNASTVKDDKKAAAELAARAAEWSTHFAPDGRPYYYHAARQDSVWEKPLALLEHEEHLAKLEAEKKAEIEKKVEEIKEEKIEVIDVEAHAEAKAAAEREREREAKEKEAREKEAKEKEAKEREAREKAKRSRPMLSMPITGTPWCVVWTGDGSVFFFNPTANSSVWERPAQLIGRADVDKAVSQPPAALKELQKKESAAGGAAVVSGVAGGPAGSPAGGVAGGVAAPSAQPKGKPNGELKRPADTDSEDSEPEPAKKSKEDDKDGTAAPGAAGKKPAAAIDAGKDAAIEAEIRAARVRAVVPFEQRVRSFLQLLHESDVSAFSPWEKELHKIVFDSSYLLLNTKERKQVFDRYVRERAEEERKEKNNRLQQKRNDFRALMEDAKLHAKSSFTDFSSKYGRDERFKAIDKLRERKAYFTEYIAEVRKREKEDKDKKREQVKTEFIALLKEKVVDRHARWADAKKKVDNDPRYKAVESSAVREDYFREYCKLVKDERKKDKDGKEKERARSVCKKDKKEKEKDKEKDKEKEKEKDGKKEKKKEKAGEQAEASAAEGAADGAAEAPAGGAGGGAPGSEAAAREREARAAASIKEREKEVQKALATSLRDRDKEREYHKRDEAVQHFNALLSDLVRNPDLTWREAKKQLKKDHRYALAKQLTKDDMERLFVAHTGALAGRRRERLRALLAELPLAPTAAWRDARRALAELPAAPQYASAAQMEREYRDYQRDRQSAAKTALRQLLQETRGITHRSLAAARDSAPAALALHDSIRHDARYTALDHIPEERQQIITGYLEELEKKGPPPPPTATEPSRRSKLPAT